MNDDNPTMQRGNGANTDTNPVQQVGDQKADNLEDGRGKGCVIYSDSGGECGRCIDDGVRGGGGTTPPPSTYTVKVNSTNPTSGVSITVSPADVNGATNGATSFTRTYDSGVSATLTAPATASGSNFSSWTGCTSTSGTGGTVCSVTMNSNTTVTANYSTPTQVQPTVTVAVTPSSITQGAAFSVSVTVAGPTGDPTPTGAITLSSGTFSYSAGTLTSGSVTVIVPAGSWNVAAGTYTLTATYTPDANSSATYSTATGTAQVTVTAAPPQTYTLTVDSANPASGVTIGASPADNNGVTSEATALILTYNAGTDVTLTAPSTASGNTFSSWIGCTSSHGTTCDVTMNANTTATANYSTPVASYVLTVDSLNPSSGVPMTVTPQGETVSAQGTTPFAVTGAAGATYVVTAPNSESGANFGGWAGCTSASSENCTVTLNANVTITASYVVTPTVTVTPVSASVNTEQGLQVTVTVAGPSGDPTPTGSVVLSNGSGYTSAGTTLSGGSASITIPAGSLSLGLNALTATYTPDAQSSPVYAAATGSHAVTENTIMPTVTVTTSPSTIDTQQSLQVTMTVAGPSGDPTPTGSVAVSDGSSYSSVATTLSGGSATITIAAGTLPTGSDTLTATYTPDSPSSSIYGTATGTSGPVTVQAVTTVTVNQSSNIGIVTDLILGVNMAIYNDFTQNTSAIENAYALAGLVSLRWPGGSNSDLYHWNSGNANPANGVAPTPSQCGGSGFSNTNYLNFINDIEYANSSLNNTGIGYNIALTANYGSNPTCNGGGLSGEAANWATYANANGGHVSYMTVGNEVFGSWEYDLHAVQHDPTTYADAVIGSNGYYSLIKAASPSTLVGVVVDAGCTEANSCTNNWDPTVLSLAKGYYDFVEYHYAPQSPGRESDSFLIYDAAPELTANINLIKSELATAGEPNTPIYVGEMGEVSSNIGKQSWSITSALYAGQILGEMMNDSVSRVTWWTGFGDCNGDNGNDSSSLYGWQNFGAWNIFADAPGDTGGSNNSPCNYGGPIGTMNPTARAFQLFSQVAVSGEQVETVTLSGDTTDVRAYAATHIGGTALVLFNLNKTASEPVQITPSSDTSTSDIQVTTYDKEMYDYTNTSCQSDPTCTYDPSHNYSTVQWAAPTTTDLGEQTLPYTLTLQPWSMNVVIIQ